MGVSLFSLCKLPRQILDGVAYGEGKSDTPRMAARWSMLPISRTLVPYPLTQLRKPEKRIFSQWQILFDVREIRVHDFQN